MKFLMASIVRDSSNYTPDGHSFMVKKYYDKGILAARYSQSDIAKFFGLAKNGKPNQGYVSRLIKQLEQRGMLQVMRSTCPQGKKCDYIFGFHNGKSIDDKEYAEILFFDIIFTHLAARAKRKRNEERGVENVVDRIKNTEERVAWFLQTDSTGDSLIEGNVCGT